MPIAAAERAMEPIFCVELISSNMMIWSSSSLSGVGSGRMPCIIHYGVFCVLRSLASEL